jgi:hypothetical protein
MLDLKSPWLPPTSFLAGFLLLSTGAGLEAAAEAGEALPACGALADFDSADFSSSTQIDSRWFPLIPGMQYVFRGFANRGGRELPHSVTFTVTDRTWVINGVKTRVVLDEDLNEGVLAEQELAFFAQDADANVWSVGEYPEERDEETGKIGAANVWLAGEGETEPAQAGVLVPGDPQMGLGWFLQGGPPEIELLHCAKVQKKGLELFVPIETSESLTNCVDGDICMDVMLASEKSSLDQEGDRQLKYYAPGVGRVQVGSVADPENETLALVELSDIRGTLEWTRVLYKTAELLENACNGGFTTLCP